MKKLTIPGLLMILLLLLAACNGAGAEPAADTAVSTNEDTPMTDTISDNDANHDEMSAEGAGHDNDMADDDMGHDDMADAASDEMMNDNDMSHDGITDDDMMDDNMSSDDMMADDDMADDNMNDNMAEDSSAMEMADEAMMLAVWQELPLVNARTGETFTLADFTGKTIFVEPMATWCTNCRRQLNNVKQARAGLNSADIVFVGLSLETNLDAATLAAYANNQGFDWLFAVMTPEVLQEMAAEFGQIITSAPSTPHFIIRPDGTFTELVTGIESPEAISSQILAASG